MADSGTKEFEYLLNAMENAGSQPAPHLHAYGDKRKAVLAYVAAKKLELAQTQKVRDEWCEEFTKARDDLARVTRERDAVTCDLEMRKIVISNWLLENSPGGWIDDLRVKLEAAERACDGFKAELAAAIKEADSWFDECRGNGECPGLDVGRKLLAGSEP